MGEREEKCMETLQRREVQRIGDFTEIGIEVERGREREREREKSQSRKANKKSHSFTGKRN